MRRLSVLVVSVLLAASCTGTTPPSLGPTTSPSSPASTATSGPTSVPSPAPSSTGGVTLVKSNLAQLAVDPARATDAAAAMNAFGLELYTRIGAQPGNLVISPASVALALAMTRTGAVGSTATEMDAVLHGLGSDRLAESLDALDAALAARTGTFTDSGGIDHAVLLRIANALFSQRDFALRAAFLDAMATRYGAGVWQVDFAADPEAARQAINAWVARQTEQRIPEILKRGQVTQATRLAIANAIYLKAAWLNPFDKASTARGPFTLGNGSTVQVPLMRLQARLGYAAGTGWQAVQLPYVGNGLAMTVILPDDLAAFEHSFDAARLAAIVGSFQAASVDLTMPSFDLETSERLDTILGALGMPSAFDPAAADFSGITSQERLFIGFVIHQANITVDEAGTEAAAATVVGLDTSGGGPIQAVTLRIDHPFLFALRDVATGAVVFIGRVADPSLTR